MFNYICCVLLLLINIILVTKSARILGVIPIPSYSHQIVYRNIWRELSLRGHDVTVLTTDPMNDKTLINLKEIDLSFSYELYNIKHNMSNIIAHYDKNFIKAINMYAQMMNDIVDQQLANKEVKDLIENKDIRFDLIMVEFYFPTMFAFSTHFNCPFIGLTSLDAQLYGHEVLGNPIHPGLYPDITLPFVSGSLAFHERLVSTGYYLYMKWIKWSIYSRENDSVRKHFGLNYPCLTEIERNVSMVFVNVNPGLDDMRPLSRGTVQIGGGTHVGERKELPKDIQIFMDKYSSGVIYFSLGSNVNCSVFNKHMINEILKVFSQLPYGILWKCDHDYLKHSIYGNIMVEKWFPQQDILAHENIQLFITQGGLQSIEEAIYFKVPILGIPFYFDQKANIKKMVEKGCGSSIDPEFINMKLKKTIIEIIDNRKYYNNIKELNRLVNDQPMTGLQKAIWWTEYVIRNNGAKHLKSPSVDFSLYKYFFLDIALFVVILLSLLIFFLLQFRKFIIVATKEKLKRV